MATVLATSCDVSAECIQVGVHVCELCAYHLHVTYQALLQEG